MANAVHYPSLASFGDVEMVAACEMNAERLNETADRYNIQGRYTDYRQMIEETKPDAVYAIGGPDIMYNLWVWCLERGLNLFVEKLLGITRHQARNLEYLAEQKGCVTQVGFQRRTNPLLTARDHLMDDSIHAIDTLRRLCGGEGADIQC